jgi:hypothetical protein
MYSAVALMQISSAQTINNTTAITNATSHPRVQLPQRTPLLQWDFSKQSGYTQHVLSQQHIWQQLAASIASSDIHLAAVLLSYGHLEW